MLVDAKTLMVLAANYFQGPILAGPRENRPLCLGRRLSPDYATEHGSDRRFLREKGGRQKCYVDTGPILERDFAATAGLYWRGKSTICLNERLGTWFFIGVILTTLEFAADSSVSKSVRLLYPLHRRLSYPGHYPPLPARCSPLYLLPDD